MIKRFLIFLMFLLYINYFGQNQLQKIYIPNLYSEANLYRDESGSLYSTVIRVKFTQRTVDLSKGEKIATFNEILIPQVKLTLNEIKKKYGNFKLVKEFPNSEWGDTIGIHIVTKEKVKLRDLSQFYELIFDDVVCIDSIKAYLKNNNYFEAIYGPFQVILTFEPNDYLPSEQWGLAKIEAQKAWDITRSSEDVKIGISDFWLCGSNEDCIHYELRGTKFEHIPVYWGKGHGSQVAGVAGCLTNNNQGIASIGFDTKLLLSLPHPSWIDSLRRAGSHIINCSWFNANGDEQDLNSAIYNCLATGVIVTAASGNNQANVDLIGVIPVVLYPAAYNYIINGKHLQVIAVTATSMYNNMETFGWPPDGDWNYSPSNDPINDPTNSFVDFAAPGVFIKVLNDANNYGYTFASGTSLSAPMVAGLLGLIKSIYTDLTSEIAYTILKNSSEKVGSNDYNYVNNTWSPHMGYGRINAYKALKYTIENYGGTFSHDIIVPAGDTWNIKAGVTLKFNPGAALVVNGTLNVQGNSSNKVTFTRNGSSGNWVGIRFNSGSSGSINYADIQYANYGIYFNYLGYNSIQVQNSYIQNNNGYGIYAVNSSLMSINNNHILNNGSYGIYCTNYSSPYIRNNYITGHSIAGIYSNYYSNPSTNDGVNPGANVIKSNTGIGLYAYYNSNPSFGTSNGGGYNSIFNNNSYEVKAEYNCIVNAQYNWWGSYPPSTSEFYTSQSTINYQNALSSDPNSGRGLILAENNEYTTGISLKKAINSITEIETEGDYDKEIEYYLEQLRKEGNTLLGRYALIKIEELYNKLNKDGFEEFINKEIFSRKDVKDELTVMGLELINHGLLKKGDYKGVIKNLEKIRKELQLNEHIEKNTLFALGSIYLNVINDKKEATKYFDELKQKYPRDILVYNSELLLGNKPEFTLFEKWNEGKEEIQIEEEYSLTMGNYPNPFNPSTVISYQIPERNLVTIKVYDILGREVATLVNEYKDAGSYTIRFSAEEYRLTSGVYLYVLHSGSKRLVSKMLYLK